MSTNWITKRLSEVSKINYGYTDSASATNVGPKFLRITDIQDNSVDWVSVPYCKCSKEDLSKYQLTSGDIVFARTGATTGKSYLIKNPPNAIFASYLIRVKINSQKELLPEFLALAFQTRSYWDSVSKGVSGSAQAGFNASKLGELEIPIPSLPEQQCIVSILDEAFFAIAKAKSNTEKNLQNARELFESYLQSVLSNTDWEQTTLENEIDLLTGFAFKSREYTTAKDGILLLRGDNIMQGDLRWEDAKRWKKSEYNTFQKYHLQENDIVLAMDRPWVKAGLKCARLSRMDLPALLVQRTACLRNKSIIDNSFLYYIIKSKAFMDHLIDLQTGIGVPHISGKHVLDFVFNKPSIGQQQAIVQKLDALSIETKKLETIYQQKLNDLEELKKSILQKAFSGELKTREEVMA